MRLRHAALGSALFFALAPGVVAGVLPWWLTRWRMSPAPLAVRIAGAVLVLVAVPSLARLFVRFVRDRVETRTYTLADAAAVLGTSEERVLQLVEAGLPERASRLRRPGARALTFQD